MSHKDLREEMRKTASEVAQDLAQTDAEWATAKALETFFLGAPPDAYYKILRREAKKMRLKVERAVETRLSLSPPLDKYYSTLLWEAEKLRIEARNGASLGTRSLRKDKQEN